MRHWHLPSVAGSSSKATPREAGSDAPRTPSTGQQWPRVLFSAPECRIVVVDLRQGEDMADHQVRERAVVQVVSGQITIESGGETIECEVGTLVTFEPGERHAVHCLADARLLLLLAPWPAPGHHVDDEEPHAHEVPVNASVDPMPTGQSADG